MTQVRTREAPTVISPAFVSAESAAAYTGLSERTVWRLIKDRRLASHRVGRRVLIRVADLDRLVTGQDVQSPST